MEETYRYVIRGGSRNQSHDYCRSAYRIKGILSDEDACLGASDGQGFRMIIKMSQRGITEKRR